MDFLNSPNFEIDQKRQSTYPTFRAWELINRLLVSYDRDGFLTKESILGTLGRPPITDTGVLFTEYLVSQGVEF